MNHGEHDEELLRSAALQNVQSILEARQRAENALLETKRQLEARSAELAETVARLTATLDARRESDERLRAIFGQATAGVAETDLSGRFTLVNPTYCRIVGRSAEELYGLRMQDITHADDLARNLPLFSRLASEGVPYTIEKRYVRPDGAEVWVGKSASPIIGSDGRPHSAVVIVQDITDRKHVELTLKDAAKERAVLLESERAARSQAERMSALKDQFLATLSHELRTPLSAILGWSQVLRLRKLAADESDQALQTIERNARVQIQLIEDLLDMSRITTGKLRLDIQRLQPIAVVEAAIATVRPAIDAKGLRLEQVLDSAAGPVSGDPNRLQQVIWNLLSNAVKFTPKGGRIQIRLERVNSHIEISVADTGIGIRHEFLPYVFEQFRQADASTTREHGGLGLGLSIVKHLVELHGGSVRAASPGEQRGATFTVRLPITIVHENEMPEPRVHPASSSAATFDWSLADLAGVKVLAVDDEPDACLLIKRVLAECNADVVTSTSATEALTLVEQQRPHVLVSDIGMPGVDGYELLKRVRALGTERGGNVAAIALTAFARSEDRTRALRAGFGHHLSKPVEPSELIATVASVAGRTGDAAGTTR